MATRPTTDPTWATGGSAVKINPTTAKREIGWTNGEKPPAGFFNYTQNSAGEWILYLDASAGGGIFGDGSDGAAVFNGSGAVTGCSGTGPYTATRDLSYTTATFSAGVILNMAGFRLYVRDTLTMTTASPAIRCNGNAGTAGAGGGTGGVRPGASGVLGALSGGAGGGGGINGGTSVTLATALGGQGGAGGAGDGGGGSPGTSTLTTVTAAMGSIHVPPSLQTGLLFGASGMTPIQGGSGGGGGQGSGVLAGGGGGAGGGVLLICAREVNFSATALVTAIGGAGGAGAVGGGGGGGGGGGYIVFLYRSTVGTAPGTIIGASAYAGGAGGANGGGASANGSAGAAGGALVIVI